MEKLGVGTAYVYDADGRVTETYDNYLRFTHIHYDDDGRAIETVDPDGIATFKAYDDDGRVTGTADGFGHTWQTSTTPTAG